VAIRQPIYLDIDLLQNTADYLEIGYPVEESVREKGAHERSAGGGLGVGVGPAQIGIGGSRGSSDEVERSYSVPVRPVKVFNDVLDGALAAGDVLDLTAPGAVWSASRRDMVQMDGEADQSGITTVGALLSKALPLMAPTLSKENPAIPPEFMTLFLGGGSGGRALLFELHPTSAPIRVYMQLDEAWFHRNATPDDVSGEVSVFAVIDQIVPEGASFDLTRYLLPGANRAARRAFSPESTRDLLAKFGQADTALTVDGPVWLVRPIGIF